MSRFPRSCIVPFDPIRALASSTSSSKELHNQIALFWTTVQQTKQCQGQMAFWLPSLLPRPTHSCRHSCRRLKSDPCKHKHRVHVHRRRIKTLGFNQPLDVRSVHSSLFSHGKYKPENQAGRSFGLYLCSAAEHITAETFPGNVVPALRRYRSQTQLQSVPQCPLWVSLAVL